MAEPNERQSERVIDLTPASFIDEVGASFRLCLAAGEWLEAARDNGLRVGVGFGNPGGGRRGVYL